MSDLAIIIPAYKVKFFDKVLFSFSHQTCKNFTIYVGDDASGEDFLSIINKYSNSIDVKYYRFEKNLGGKDLVAQWERCIALSKSEPWIWLFSDDDMVEPNAVESFYQALKENRDTDIYHFNVKVINSSDSIIRIPKSFPSIMSSREFYTGKMSSKYDSFVVEFIFRRAVYEREAGFVKFDMAWGSDVATWVKFGRTGGIITIPDGNVLWRESDQNITPNHKSDIVLRKISANWDFLSWASQFLEDSQIALFNKYALLRIVTFYSGDIKWRSMTNLLTKARDKKIISLICVIVLSLFFPIIRLLRNIKHGFERQ